MSTCKSTRPQNPQQHLHENLKSDIPRLIPQYAANVQFAAWSSFAPPPMTTARAKTDGSKRCHDRTGVGWTTQMLSRNGSRTVRSAAEKTSLNITCRINIVNVTSVPQTEIKCITFEMFSQKKKEEMFLLKSVVHTTRRLGICKVLNLDGFLITFPFPNPASSQTTVLLKVRAQYNLSQVKGFTRTVNYVHLTHPSESNLSHIYLRQLWLFCILFHIVLSSFHYLFSLSFLSYIFVL